MGGVFSMTLRRPWRATPRRGPGSRAQSRSNFAPAARSTPRVRPTRAPRRWSRRGAHPGAVAIVPVYMPGDVLQVQGDTRPASSRGFDAMNVDVVGPAELPSPGVMEPG